MHIYIYTSIACIISKAEVCPENASTIVDRIASINVTTAEQLEPLLCGCYNNNHDNDNDDDNAKSNYIYIYIYIYIERERERERDRKMALDWGARRPRRSFAARRTRETLRFYPGVLRFWIYLGIMYRCTKYTLRITHLHKQTILRITC